jgi:hypothetical protein
VPTLDHRVALTSATIFEFRMRGPAAIALAL